jgi:transposase
VSRDDAAARGTGSDTRECYNFCRVHQTLRVTPAMERRPGYDHLEERRFEFIPMWGFLVFFMYRMRRVNCPRCGVVVEAVPWWEREASNSTFLGATSCRQKLSQR